MSAVLMLTDHRIERQSWLRVLNTFIGYLKLITALAFQQRKCSLCKKCPADIPGTDETMWLMPFLDIHTV